MVVRSSGLALALVDVEDALARQLIHRDDVPRAVGQRVDADPFAILLVAGRPEQRELAVGAGRIRVRMPLVDPGLLVGVVDVAELVVERSLTVV